MRKNIGIVTYDHLLEDTFAQNVCALILFHAPQAGNVLYFCYRTTRHLLLKNGTT